MEPLLAALFSRRGVRMLDYNLQLLQPLDERTVCAVLVASVQHTEPAQVIPTPSHLLGRGGKFELFLAQASRCGP